MTPRTESALFGVVCMIRRGKSLPVKIPAILKTIEERSTKNDLEKFYLIFIFQTINYYAMKHLL